MNNSSRAINSIRNTVFALGAQLILAVTTFVTRTILIHELGNAYLGLSSLFYDILSLLSLAELGVGTAITFSMYKPMADKNYKQVTATLIFYKNVYISIGLIMSAVGLLLTPFIEIFITDIPDLPHLQLIYILYLFNTTGSYFFSYKRSVLIADQNDYAASIAQIVSSVIQCAAQVILLITIKDFVAYLIAQFFCTMLMNILISFYVDKKYVYIKEYKRERLDEDTKNIIWKNVGAMFISKVSSAIVTSTDNLLISTFVSTIVLGYYSNYTIFVNLVRRIFTKIFDAITGSVGNLAAVENEQTAFRKFEDIWFVNFWMVGFITAVMYVCINPLILCWLGEGYLLNSNIVFLIILNMYMRFIRNTFLTFVDSYGLFREVRVKCIAEALINIGVSLFLVGPLKMGVAGILLGTFISNITTNFWYEPFVIYRRLKAPLKLYFISFTKYFVLTVMATVISILLCDMIFIGNYYLQLVIDGVVCCIVINGLFWLFLHKTRHYIYFQSVLLKILHRS